MPQNRRKKPRFCIFPNYNWCGPGCNGPGPPINEVDAVCKMHDICYKIGRDHCECDREFIERLSPLITSQTLEGRHAHLLHHYMKLQSVFTCKTDRH